jgi:hypothetical protein
MRNSRRPSATCSSPGWTTAAAAAPFRLLPSKVICPAVLRSRPESVRSKVDLLAPLLPTSATKPPAGTSIDTPSRTLTRP